MQWLCNFGDFGHTLVEAPDRFSAIKKAHAKLGLPRNITYTYLSVTGSIKRVGSRGGGAPKRIQP